MTVIALLLVLGVWGIGQALAGILMIVASLLVAVSDRKRPKENWESNPCLKGIWFD